MKIRMVCLFLMICFGFSVLNGCDSTHKDTKAYIQRIEATRIQVNQEIAKAWEPYHEQYFLMVPPEQGEANQREFTKKEAQKYRGRIIGMLTDMAHVVRINNGNLNRDTRLTLVGLFTMLEDLDLMDVLDDLPEDVRSDLLSQMSKPTQGVPAAFTPTLNVPQPDLEPWEYRDIPKTPSVR